MTDPFRDLGDPAAAMRFSQHVGIAADELERIEAIPRRIAAWEDGDGATQELMNQLALEWAAGWEAVWQQLDEARAVVTAKGRDASAYDAARAAAGDIYADVAAGRAVELGISVELSWRAASTKPAHDAIAALRAAMPDVVVVKQAPIDVDLRPTGNKVVELLYAAAGLGGLAVLAYLVYRAVT